MSLDLSAPIRTAVIGDTTITDELPAYAGSVTVFTRVPVPDDAAYPMIVIHAQMHGGDDDGINDQRPTVLCDVTTYGRNDTAAHYRQVETIAFAVRELFHRKRLAISVSGWAVVDIQARGPSPAPADGEQIIVRRVELAVRLARQN